MKHFDPIRENGKEGLRAWALFVLLLFFIKALFLWLDHRPMFFLGDSASYIWTALSGWIPPDRSALYGFYVHLVAATTNSLIFLVVTQVLLSGISALLLAQLLIRYFHVRHWLAFGAALLLAAEPLQLLYERYVMTEAIAMTVLALYIWAGLHYIKHPQQKWLWVVQAFAALLIALRFAFMPLVWICCMALPVIALCGITDKSAPDPKPLFGRLAVHLTISIIALFSFTSVYKHINGYIQDKPAAYSYAGGFFALSFIAPILEYSDFPDESTGRRILETKFPITDRRWRMAHHWVDGGVVYRLKELEPDELKADAMARRAVVHAVTRKPLAFIQLGWETFIDYFDGPYFKSCMEIDLGDRELEPQFLDVLTFNFNYPRDSSSALDLKTLTGRYFMNSGNWFRFLLFLPMAGVLLLISLQKTQSRSILFLTLISAVTVGVAIFLVERPTIRFLHPAAWFFFMIIGIWMNQVWIHLRKS